MASAERSSKGEPLQPTRPYFIPSVRRSARIDEYTAGRIRAHDDSLGHGLALPLGYKDARIGAERVRSGAYLGYGDMFLFMADGTSRSMIPRTVATPVCSADSCSATLIWVACAYSRTKHVR